MHSFEKVLVIGLLFVTFMLCMPLFIINPNDVVNGNSQYIFFAMNLSFLKTWIIVQGVIGLLLLYAFHHPFKVYVTDTLGFHGNSYLLYFLGIMISLSGFLAMGDMLTLFSYHTTILQLTWMYYGIQIVLILLLGFVCYILFTQHTQKHYRGHVVGYHDKQKNRSDYDNTGGLFE